MKFIIGLLLSSMMYSKDDKTGKAYACLTVPTTWIVQDAHVCYGAKSKSYGKFHFNRNGILVAVRLVHLSGYVSSHANGSNWGKYRKECDNKNSRCINTHITDQYDNRIFHHSVNADANGNYILPGFFVNDHVLILKPLLGLNANVNKTAEYRIWFGYDQNYDSTAKTNRGSHCVRVDASFYE